MPKPQLSKRVSSLHIPCIRLCFESYVLFGDYYIWMKGNSDHIIEITDRPISLGISAELSAEPCAYMQNKAQHGWTSCQQSNVWFA